MRENRDGILVAGWDQSDETRQPGRRNKGLRRMWRCLRVCHRPEIAHDATPPPREKAMFSPRHAYRDAVRSYRVPTPVLPRELRCNGSNFALERLDRRSTAKLASGPPSWADSHAWSASGTSYTPSTTTTTISRNSGCSVPTEYAGKGKGKARMDSAVASADHLLCPRNPNLALAARSMPDFSQTSIRGRETEGNTSASSPSSGAAAMSVSVHAAGPAASSAVIGDSPPLTATRIDGRTGRVLTVRANSSRSAPALHDHQKNGLQTLRRNNARVNDDITGIDGSTSAPPPDSSTISDAVSMSSIATVQTLQLSRLIMSGSTANITKAIGTTTTDPARQLSRLIIPSESHNGTFETTVDSDITEETAVEADRSVSPGTHLERQRQALRHQDGTYFNLKPEVIGGIMGETRTEATSEVTGSVDVLPATLALT